MSTQNAVLHEQHTHILTPQEVTHYKALLAKAFESAQTFTGSRETYNTLMKNLILLEDFTRARTSNGTSEKHLQESFARQAGMQSVLLRRRKRCRYSLSP